MNRLYIGIDPGAKTGFAVSYRGKLQRVETTDFWGAIMYIDNLVKTADGAPIVLVIERPDLNKPVWISRKPGMSKKLQDNIAQKVGANKRDAILLVEYAERMGMTVIPVRPKAGGTTKTTPEYFKKITGWTKRTSEHSRDAAMMIIGR